MMQDALNIVLFLLAIIGALMIAINMENNKKHELSSNACGFDTTIEYENIKRLHKYHGILSSYEINDNWLFLRDGEVCSLYDPLTRTDND